MLIELKDYHERAIIEALRMIRGRGPEPIIDGDSIVEALEYVLGELECKAIDCRAAAAKLRNAAEDILEQIKSHIKD